MMATTTGEKCSVETMVGGDGDIDTAVGLGRRKRRLNNNSNALLLGDDSTAASSTTSFSGGIDSLAHPSSGGNNNNNNNSRTLALDSSFNTFERSSGLLSDSKNRLSITASKRKTNSLDDITINKLNFDNVDLMGRDKEVEVLNTAFDKVASSTTTNLEETTKKQFVLLSGYSGVGKTRLARTLYHSVKKNKNQKTGVGLCVEGKFDQNYTTNCQPYSALSSICGMICAKILDSDRSDEICNALAMALGSETKLLIAAFPVLEEILQNRDFQQTEKSNAANKSNDAGTTQHQRPEETKFRLNFAFCRFLRVLGQFFAPLVMILDDLQWADVPSLDLLQDILGDRDNKKLMIVGIYRSNEIGDSHVFSSVLRVLRKRRGTKNVFHMQEINVGNLDFDAIWKFLQDLLGTTDNSTMWLASACEKKTYGNVFFMIHFLKYIYSKQLLQYNFGMMKWQWNEEEIENNTMTSDNVVDFLLRKMKDMTERQKDVLRLASHLGASFEERNLTLLWNQLHKKLAGGDIDEDMEAALDACILDGYLYECSSSDDKRQYVFVHDKVQEAAQMLTRHAEMASFQKWIGQTLLAALEPEGLGPMLFVVVNLLNEGDVPTEQSKQVDLAELNCHACKAAMNASAFQAVSRQAGIGIRLLGVDAFHNHQKLALDLCSMGASAECCLGNIESMENYCQAVMQRSDVAIEDKLRVYSTWLESLANRGKIVQAVNESLDLLKQFDIRFPSNRVIQTFATLRTYLKVKKEIRNGLLKRIVDLPMEQDPLRGQLIYLMDRLSVYLFYLHDDLMPLVMFRNLKWTVKYGLNDISAVSLTTFGLLSGVMGDIKQGSECAQTAIDLIPRVSPLIEGRILFVAHAFGVVWTKPMQEQLTPLQKGYTSALCAGDKESACWSIYSFCLFRFLTSFSLDLIIADVQSYMPQMLELNQIISYRSMLANYQMMMNLAGRTETDPRSITGEFLKEEDHTVWLLEDPFYESQCKHWKTYILTVYGEHEECAKLALEQGTYYGKKSNPGAFQIALMEVFSKGISSFVAARTSSDKRMCNKYRKSAMAIRKRVKDWIGTGCPNFAHLNLFFDAEVAALQGKRHSAIQTYQAAIVIAARGGWMMDAGYFSEIFAEYLLQLGERDDALFRLQESLKYFREFGAVRKVTMIEDTHAELLSPQTRSIDVIIQR